MEAKKLLDALDRINCSYMISDEQKIMVDGVTYIGDQDACPWTIYAKYDEQMIETL